MGRDFFVLKEYLKWLRSNARVGFVVDYTPIQPYNRALASIRCRCYDIMIELEKRGIRSEIFRYFRKYDIVIFTKTYSKKAYSIARYLFKRNIPFIMDSYCEFENDENRREEFDRLILMVEHASAVISYSEQQLSFFKDYNNNCVYLPEAISDDILKNKKTHQEKETTVLVWCGYSNKGSDLLSIKKILDEFVNSGKYELMIISERDPNIKELTYKFIRYNNCDVGKNLCKGDVFLAPRDLSRGKNTAHSIMRICLPMAVGLPVVGSEVPSYRNTPIKLCKSECEWREAIISFTNFENRQIAGALNRRFVIENASISVICDKYLELIDRIINERNC